MAKETINYPDGTKYVGTFKGWKVWNGSMISACGKSLYVFEEGQAMNHHIESFRAETAAEIASPEMVEEAKQVALQLSENFSDETS